MTSTEPTGRLCGAMEIHRRLLTESESYRIARAQLETATMGFTALEVDETVVARVPVVVHVVHSTDQQNISDAQVHSQIAVLNEDFRATNADTGTVPGVFADLVHDARVEFVLADVDPDGRQTTGITRTRTRVRTFGTDDGVKDPARGGVAAWPADRYLNIWVCPTQRRPARLRPVPRRARRDGRGRDHLHRLRHHRHRDRAVPPRPHRHPRDRPLLQPVPHLGRRRHRLRRHRRGRRHPEPGRAEHRQARPSRT